MLTKKDRELFSLFFTIALLAFSTKFLNLLSAFDKNRLSIFRFCSVIQSRKFVPYVHYEVIGTVGLSKAVNCELFQLKELKK